MTRFGIDISHHQTPEVVPWADLQERKAFLYIRAAYGRKRDTRVLDHVARAKAHGLDYGLYTFFRATEPVDAQLETFHSVADAVKYGVGDLVPALDVEADGKHRPVKPEWSDPAEQMCLGLERRYGSAIIYISQREFRHLGSPMWVLRRPLWVAHYTQYAPPATPAGKPWYIWQYTVSPYAPDGPWVYDTRGTPLDHNRMSGPALRIDAPENQTTVRPSTAIPYVHMLDWDAMTEERDRKVQGDGD